MKSNIQIGISTTSSVGKSYILALDWLEISTLKNDCCYFDITSEQIRGEWISLVDIKGTRQPANNGNQKAIDRIFFEIPEELICSIENKRSN